MFEAKKINTTRQIEVDLSRGTAAILIILCHVGLYLGDPNDNILQVFCDICGSEFGAPVFMAMMGISMVYSKHQKAKNMLIRGLKLFIGGFILSFFRSLLPLLLLGNIDEWTSISAFFVVDILQLAGLSFMLLAFFKKIKLPVWVIYIISLIMVWLAQYVHPVVENEGLTYLVNLFFHVNSWSCFPFFIWFYFPTFGLLFGEILVRCKDKDKLYGILLPISVCAVIFVYYQLYVRYPNYTNYYYGHNFYYMGVLNVLLNSLFITFLLSFFYFMKKIMPTWMKKYLLFLSSNLNTYYIITWLYISIMIHLQAIYHLVFNGSMTVVLMLILFVVCYYSTKAYNYIGKKKV